MRVLLVDDNRDLKDIFDVVVEERKDIKATFIDSSLDALKYLTDNQVDVAIIDLRMPYMDGLRLVKEAKKNQPYPTHFICYTGDALEPDVKKMVRNAGFEGFYVKPHHLSDVIDDLTKRYAAGTGG